MSNRVGFIVLGRPRPQPKTSTRGKRRFYPTSYTDYKDSVIAAAAAAKAELEDRGDPFEAASKHYGIKIRFWMPDHRRTDIDRLESTVLDSVTKAGLWPDDRFCDEMASKRGLCPEDPRIEVEVTRL